MQKNRKLLFGAISVLVVFVIMFTSVAPAFADRPFIFPQIVFHYFYYDAHDVYPEYAVITGGYDQASTDVIDASNTIIRHNACAVNGAWGLSAYYCMWDGLNDNGVLQQGKFKFKVTIGILNDGVLSTTRATSPFFRFRGAIDGRGVAPVLDPNGYIKDYDFWHPSSIRGDVPSYYPYPFFEVTTNVLNRGGKIEVLDVAGNVVKNLCAIPARSAGVTCQWNGSKDVGGYVVHGVYKIRITLTTNTGGKAVKISPIFYYGIGISGM